MSIQFGAAVGYWNLTNTAVFYKLKDLYIFQPIGIPVKFSTVIIVIEDENDNSPNFTYIEKVITIPDDILIGSIITTVVATDMDKPNTNFSAIEYNITGGNGTGYFDIGKETGEVTTLEDLNRKPSNKSQIYDIIIQAQDKAFPFNSVHESMIIIVDDAGNNPPVITFPEDNSFLKMPEVCMIFSCI
ncbi:Cadherin EGF LAG seven-pass G-type receptor 1 [Holothuria leucospilota]|uniref:Cadherin EGF LAG seven-pass G-type receptor 1 n=1 Tax=Holothuria leucospilota TaxID=206669 RepID=A0A9Q1CSG0_HOLLE|nr:Cadherin EGF LAG seven-pass G-type receptor 1 [Holothuria leucospilota]